MVKRQSSPLNIEAWLKHVTMLRHGKDAALLQRVIAHYSNADAYLLNKGMHIADILLMLGLDSETLAAALIYPAVQMHLFPIDNVDTTLDVVSNKLLHDVLQMQSLNKLHRFELRNFQQTENLRKMLLAMVTDVRAILIILAEKLWNLHEAKNLETELQKQIAQETLDIFAPLANRLGVWQIKWEMEDLCLRYLQPDIYAKIAKWLVSKRIEREAYIQNMLQLVSDKLKEAKIQNFQISGRVKHIYSIYRKMIRKKSNLEEIYDISALRVLVPEVADCYNVLSILQNAWPHILKEYDDYISQPKSNGYQSIHTVLLGPSEHFVEVQIRTYQMHQDSELGVAAHWQYKEGVLQPSSYDAKITLLRQVFAWQKDMINNQATSEQSIQDLFDDHVYVFTPLGDIVDLPKGSTPLDFAYYIHSEVGHRCRGAKVDGHIVSLKYKLQTGARVEILTAKHASPSRDWLNPQLGYLFTSRARAKAQHWFRVKDSLQHIQNGRDLLEKELKRISYAYKYDLNKLAPKFNLHTADDLLAALSTGDVRVAQVVNYLRPADLTPNAVRIKSSHLQAASNVQILGINNLLTQIAQCCKPLPGDLIVGYITRTRGVSIHRNNCKNIASITLENQKRLIGVNWGESTLVNYPVDLYLRLQDRAGLIRDITATLAGEKISVSRIQTQKKDTNEVEVYLTIEICTRLQLNKSINLLINIPNMLEVSRR